MPNPTNIRLQVLICTIGQEGIMRVCNSHLPEVEGVEYLVTWQQPNEPISVPQKLALRDDVKVLINQSEGLSRNRNMALQAATAEYLLIGDDDVGYLAEGLTSVIEAFDELPGADVICGRYVSRGKHVKTYPLDVIEAKHSPKGWYPSSIEIAIRRKGVGGSTPFNENFGAGSRTLFQSGEEAVWLADVRSKGGTVMLVPIDFGTHDAVSTGERDGASLSFVMTHGAVMSYIHPRTWMLRMLTHAYAASQNNLVPFWKYIRVFLSGVRYARRIRVFNTD